MYHDPLKQNRFADLGRPERVWAISSIHSNISALTDIHDVILEYFEPGHKIIYLGNFTGFGEQAVATIDEILAFRRLILSERGVLPEDFVYLRGSQEESWAKLLQLQFAPNPGDVLLWMLGNGLSTTLYSYGISPHDGIEACRAGTIEITKWTASIRQAVRAHPGHDTLATHLVQAAYTDQNGSAPILFVHSGLDGNKSVEAQGDNFWWGSGKFDDLCVPYAPFKKVVRGCDPERKGLQFTSYSASIDGGSGFDGNLICAGFDADGEMVELFES